MKLKTLSLIALTLAGLGTVVLAVSTVIQLVQQGLIKGIWLSLMGLSLAALGVIILVVTAYAQRMLTFNFFAVLMVSVLALISAAFHILGQLQP